MPLRRRREFQVKILQLTCNLGDKRVGIHLVARDDVRWQEVSPELRKTLKHLFHLPRSADETDYIARITLYCLKHLVDNIRTVAH